MAQALSYYEYDNLKRHAWWFTKEQIGQDLRERYEVPKNLPPELLTLVRKLDDSDWLFLAFSWRNDVDFLP